MPAYICTYIYSRPQRAPVPQYQTVPANLEPDVIDRLDAIADDDDEPINSRTAAIREAVANWLDAR